MDLKKLSLGVIGAGAVLLIAMSAGYYFLFAHNSSSQESLATLDSQIKQAYDNMGKLTFKPGDASLGSSLKTLRDIAADENTPVVEKIQALNGINFAYAASNFDAATVYDVVFSKPPFSDYYVPSASSSDPVHPNAHGDTKAVDAAMIKLNAYSNSLLPNHYALARMEVGKVFEYERAVSENPAQKDALRHTYAEQLKELTRAYDALPDIETKGNYPFPLMLQLMYLQASSLSFIGSTEADQAYLDRGEQLYLHVLSLASDTLKSDPTNLWIKNQLEFARMFYLMNYWNYHKNTDSLQPLIAVADALADDYDANLPLYSQYIPAHKNGSVEPSKTLRVAAESSPKLKALLEHAGWQF